MAVEDIKVTELKSLEKVEDLIVGLPDVGLVGLITSNHLMRSLKMEEVGFLESDILPPVMIVHTGLPKSPIRLYAKGGIVILTSEVPVPSSAIPILARSIINWIKDKRGERIIAVTGIAVPNRLEIKQPEVYGVASTENARKTLSQSNIQLLEEGFMVGAHAVILKESIKNDIDNVVLLAQSHYQYPDPGAAASTINALNRILELDVEIGKLLDQAEEIRLKMRDIMQRTTKSMQRMQKEQEQELPPMYV